jgi:hypothetical protein
MKFGCFRSKNKSPTRSNPLVSRIPLLSTKNDDEIVICPSTTLAELYEEFANSIFYGRKAHPEIWKSPH